MKNDHAQESSPVSEEIAATIARYRASGLGLHRFAREQGISPSRLHYWVYHRKRGGRKAGLAKPAVAPVFQEIQLTARSESSGGWAAEVGLPGGRVVRFSASASAQWIGSIVQALQRPC
jgi:hypothetical protein